MIENYSFDTDIQNEIIYFGLENKLNDYIGVQKSVISKLESEDFFGEIINEQTGLIIEINKKGIKETLGSGKRFQNLPRVLKELKIATIRKLPYILKNANISIDNVKNTHGDASKFAYFKLDMKINGVPINVSIDVKRTAAKNKFWIHYIHITKENSQLLSPAKEQAINEIENSSKDSI